ncbi:unnamed protein product [Cuscuta campestris]|uniref:AB hydrolase-1 domain-containing protein n=1 Tax=Cuscuta campestris TaxID=132261 RepID=A0A484LVE4_9ASTE|nr:unnamed protein product [Cuscuta campestris]
MHMAGTDQDEFVDPSDLADPDSRFCEFNGVQIHHKIRDGGQPNASLERIGSLSHSHQSKRITNFPMVLLHGFGASVFSWERAMKPLAKISGSKVLAFDRPAFGLTSRPIPVDNRALNPYSMMFSVLATHYFIHCLAADKAVLVGHSAGGGVALEAYFEAPERVAALILVDPAIVAPFTSQKDNQSAGNSHIDNRNSESSLSSKKWNLFGKLLSILTNFTKLVAQVITGIVKGMGQMLNSLCMKVLAAFLRSSITLCLVRLVISMFGTTLLRCAWYDRTQVTEYILEGYTKPLRVKGWDRALVEYVIAMLTDSKLRSKPPLSQRLSEIKCPVLIVTGDKDRFIPAWNSERLSQAIPGSCYEVIKNSGHLPHEERVEEFVSVVDRFFQKVFGEVEEPLLQVVS